MTIRALVLGLLLAAWTLVGCSLSPSADFIKALGEDHANTCFKIHAIYGIGNGDALMARTNCTNCTVTCNQDGMSVRSDVPPGSMQSPGHPPRVPR